MSSFPAVLASILTQFASGIPIWRISVPCFICATKSGLEMTQEQLFSNGNCLLSLEKIDRTTDAIERIALVLQTIQNIHLIPTTDKPFNPIQGEFIDVSTTINDIPFRYQVEQISHHPPVASFRISTPTVTMAPIAGIDGSNGFAPGLNSVCFQFPGTIIEIKTKNHTLHFSQPSVMVDPLFFGTRTVGIYDLAFWIEDMETGIRFEGSIKKPSVVEGILLDKDGTILDSVSGNMFDGVFLSDERLWCKGCDNLELDLVISPETLADPNHTWNVWGKVYEQMNKSPIDWTAADVEKAKVEEKQRSDIKLRDKRYDSKFGFKCQYDNPMLSSTTA